MVRRICILQTNSQYVTDCELSLILITFNQNSLLKDFYYRITNLDEQYRFHLFLLKHSGLIKSRIFINFIIVYMHLTHFLTFYFSLLFIPSSRTFPAANKSLALAVIDKPLLIL